MSIAPSPTDSDAGGLVEMERELTRLLIEYDELETAWRKCRHVLIRARTGRQATDALIRIADLEHDITTTPASTLAGAAVKLRRLQACLNNGDVEGEVRVMLASALAVVEVGNRPALQSCSGRSFRAVRGPASACHTPVTLNADFLIAIRLTATTLVL